MAKLDELYKMVMSNRENMAAFVKASGTGSLSEFAGKYGCAATDEEIRRYFIAKCEGEISDEDAVAVSGGTADLGARIKGLFMMLHPDQK